MTKIAEVRDAARKILESVHVTRSEDEATEIAVGWLHGVADYLAESCGHDGSADILRSVAANQISESIVERAQRGERFDPNVLRFPNIRKAV